MKRWVFNRTRYEAERRKRFCRKCGDEFGTISGRMSHEKSCNVTPRPEEAAPLTDIRE